MVKVIAKIGVQASHIDFDEDKECSYYTLIGRKLQEGRSPAESAVLVFAQRSVRSNYIDGNIRPEDINPVVRNRDVLPRRNGQGTQGKTDAVESKSPEEHKVGEGASSSLAKQAEGRPPDEIAMMTLKNNEKTVKRLSFASHDWGEQVEGLQGLSELASLSFRDYFRLSSKSFLLLLRQAQRG